MAKVTKFAVFKGRKIRKTLYHNEWWFSVVDVVGVFADSENPRDYWFKMKIREKDDIGIELSTICRQLKLEASPPPKLDPSKGEYKKETEDKIGASRTFYYALETFSFRCYKKLR